MWPLVRFLWSLMHQVAAIVFRCVGNGVRADAVFRCGSEILYCRFRSVQYAKRANNMILSLAPYASAQKIFREYNFRTAQTGGLPA
ncbi:MAG: hypothetical protein CMO04_11890 [Thalassospira sp.]|nr:hypothetical protein [Thalassospira sp.]